MENHNRNKVLKYKEKNTHIFMNDKYLKEIPKILNRDNVQVLYLHNNSIARITNLDSFDNLTHLYLQWNKIKRIENMDKLESLQKLYLGNNHINVIENLENLIGLKELHVERQNLDSGEVLCFDPKCAFILGSHLQVLNVSNNKLNNFDELSSFRSLNKLIAKNNSLYDYHSVAESLKRLTKIKEVDFRGNPMCKTHRYKEKFIGVTFKLETIDGQTISDQTRDFIKCFERFQNNRATVEPATLMHRKKMDSLRKSPDAHLSILEAQRAAAMQARLNRQKLMETTNGTVPRCFWRNKNTKNSKGNANRDGNNLMGNFNNFWT